MESFNNHRMKQVIMAFVVCCLATACAPKLVEETIPGYFEVGFSSLKKYAEKGFLITPAESYGANYNSIGFIDIEVMLDAEAKIVEEVIKIRGENQFIKKRRWNAPNASLEQRQQAIDKIYEEAVSQGADALVNFKVEIIRRELENPSGLQLGLRVSGFAIDRLD